MHWLIILVFVLGVLFWFSRPKQPNQVKSLIDDYINDENELAERQRKEHDKFITRFGNFEGASEVLKIVRDNIKHMYRDVIQRCVDKKISPETFMDETESLLKKHETEVDGICSKYMIQKDPYFDLIRKHHGERIEKEKKWLKIMEPYIDK